MSNFSVSCGRSACLVPDHKWWQGGESCILNSYLSVFTLSYSKGKENEILFSLIFLHVERKLLCLIPFILCKWINYPSWMLRQCKHSCLSICISITQLTWEPLFTLQSKLTWNIISVNGISASAFTVCFKFSKGGFKEAVSLSGPNYLSSYSKQFTFHLYSWLPWSFFSPVEFVSILGNSC